MFHSWDKKRGGNVSDKNLSSKYTIKKDEIKNWQGQLELKFQISYKLEDIEQALVSLDGNPASLQELKETIVEAATKKRDLILEKAEKQHQYTPY